VPGFRPGLAFSLQTAFVWLDPCRNRDRAQAHEARSLTPEAWNL